jgi:peptidoglycan/LPS O-acetylase OafA/YrhL
MASPGVAELPPGEDKMRTSKPSDDSATGDAKRLQKAQLAPLTGLRGVAACAVLVGHALDSAFNYDLPHFHPFATPPAYFGMSLFFVLSGFVIQYNYGQSFRLLTLRTATRQFYVARFARLYPLYAVTILTVLPSLPTPWPGWINLSYLTLTQSWFNVEYQTFAPDWSISTEWFFYLAFIPLTLIASRIRNPLLAMAALCAAAIAGISLSFGLWQPELSQFARHWFWHNDVASADPWLWFTYYSPYLRVLEFMVGMLAARVHQMSSINRPDRLLPFGLLWCAIGFVVLGRNALPNLATNFLFTPGLAVVMICVSVSNGLLARALATPVMQFFGEISYSIYVWSFVAMAVLANTLTQAHPMTVQYVNSVIKFIVIFALTMVFAYGSYLLIEMPSRRWLRKVLS